MMSKKVIIIGAGIAGITAGYYARKSGYDTVILEQHNIPGGICMSWSRKGYLFEGSIHWLTGSRKEERRYKVWEEVGALGDDVKVYNHDPFFELNYKGQKIACYRDLDKFIAQLMEISPEDEENIQKFRTHIECFVGANKSIEDLDGVKFKYPKEEVAPSEKDQNIISELITMTAAEYGKRFKNEALQHFLSCVFGEDSCCMGALNALGTVMRGDGGYPEGGSLPMTQRMIKKYESIGGKIEYKTKVEQIVSEGSRVKGVLVGGKLLESDAVIYTGDLFNVNKFLEKPLEDEEFCDLHKKEEPLLVTFVSLGIKADLSKYPHVTYFDVDPFICADTEITYLGCNNYAMYDSYSPEGGTAVTFYIIQKRSSYEWWKQAKENGTYKEEKEKVAESVIKALAKAMPETAGKVEVIDVATPLTYERYCGVWAGSWMNEMQTKRPVYKFSARPQDYENLYFAGERQREPGGLPVALIAGRTAVQWLCRDDDVVFVNEEK